MYYYNVRKIAAILLLISLFTVNSSCYAQAINSVMKKYGIVPQMVSYHPDDEWFISSKSDDGNKFILLQIRDYQTSKPKIDTLDFGYYLNISKLSNDGDELLYGFLDTLSAEPTRRTYLRKYSNGSFSEPTDLRKKTGFGALTYFMLNDTGDIYFYTYDLQPKGLYKIEKKADQYSEPKLLIANRPNYVPFSPIMLDEKTMLLAQHGQEDKRVNGIYVSKKDNDQWSTPVKLEGLPYGWSLGYGKGDTIVYLVAETRMVKELSRKALKATIQVALESASANTNALLK